MPPAFVVRLSSLITTSFWPLISISPARGSIQLDGFVALISTPIPNSFRVSRLPTLTYSSSSSSHSSLSPLTPLIMLRGTFTTISLRGQSYRLLNSRSHQLTMLTVNGISHLTHTEFLRSHVHLGHGLGPLKYLGGFFSRSST